MHTVKGTHERHSPVAEGRLWATPATSASAARRTALSSRSRIIRSSAIWSLSRRRCPAATPSARPRRRWCLPRRWKHCLISRHPHRIKYCSMRIPARATHACPPIHAPGNLHTFEFAPLGMDQMGHSSYRGTCHRHRGLFSDAGTGAFPADLSRLMHATRRSERGPDSKVGLTATLNFFAAALGITTGHPRCASASRILALLNRMIGDALTTQSETTADFLLEFFDSSGISSVIFAIEHLHFIRRIVAQVRLQYPPPVRSRKIHRCRARFRDI